MTAFLINKPLSNGTRWNQTKRTLHWFNVMICWDLLLNPIICKNHVDIRAYINVLKVIYISGIILWIFTYLYNLPAIACRAMRPTARINFQFEVLLDFACSQLRSKVSLWIKYDTTNAAISQPDVNPFFFHGRRRSPSSLYYHGWPPSLRTKSHLFSVTVGARWLVASREKLCERVMVMRGGRVFGFNIRCTSGYLRIEERDNFGCIFIFECLWCRNRNPSLGGTYILTLGYAWITWMVRSNKI